MCEPTTLFAASSAIMLYSGYQQAQYQRATGEAQRNYYDYLSRTSQMEGELALRTGRQQSQMIQDVVKGKGKQLARSQAQLSASQRAIMAAQGRDPSSDSAADIVLSTADEQRLDELALRYNADVDTWGAMTDASYKNWASNVQASQYTMAGKQSEYAGKINARNTLLGTALKIGSSALTFGALGGFSGGLSTQGLMGKLTGYVNAPTNTRNMFSYTKLIKPLGGA